MALDYGILLRGPSIGQQFLAGQQAAQEEQERNMLRQMQMEQMAAQRENVLAQRQEREAHAEERRLSAARRQEEDAWLGKMADLFGQNNVPLTPETAQQGLAFALRSRNPAAIQMMQKTVEAMQARQPLDKRFVNTPYGIFDTQSEKYLMPESLPSRAAAPGAAPAPAAPKPPVGYRFTDGGNLEPIPGGPASRRAAPAGAAGVTPTAKPPTAAQVAKTEAQTQARQALSKELQTTLGYYEKLNRIGAMTSPSRSVAENLLASARATGVGQEAERAAATQAQTLRDNISNSRQRLLVHIKNATGASAQQMNSNIELQTWLNALTNPRQSIETVRETLGQLDAVIASVQNQVAQESRGKPAAALAAPSGRDLGGGFKLVD